jgi:hypothetical protein
MEARIKAQERAVITSQGLGTNLPEDLEDREEHCTDYHV